jgi:hypothetical protein
VIHFVTPECYLRAGLPTATGKGTKIPHDGKFVFELGDLTRALLTSCL